jgi:hypothetical protein
MAQVHFTSTEMARQRVIAMGEDRSLFSPDAQVDAHVRCCRQRRGECLAKSAGNFYLVD